MDRERMSADEFEDRCMDWTDDDQRAVEAEARRSRTAETALQERVRELEGEFREVYERLHRGFGWLNYPPRGLCICHEIQGGPEYDGADSYKPPADDEHDPSCDSYSEAMRLMRATLRREAEGREG